MKDRIMIIMLALTMTTCTVMVGREQTKRLNICEEYLLKCGGLGYKCSCP